MNLGFYYHISVACEELNYTVPGYLGVFIHALADEVDNLTILFHEASNAEKKDCDFIINRKNIHWISLGKKTPAWHRGFLHHKILANLKSKLSHCDKLLVRSPTPLAPFFHHYIQRSKICFMIVGDYSDGALQNHNNGFRDFIIRYFLNDNNRRFEKQIKKSNIVVNSPILFEKYKSIAKSVHQIKTTTLSQTDFYVRKDTCQQQTIKLLYTGRIDLAKGLLELVEAFLLIYKKINSVELHLVGWEYDVQEPIKKILVQKVKDLNITEHVYFHGKMKVGNELNQMYRSSDIYIIPSYHEGFPRTIWEAMANHLPVIATRVGAIPAYLTENVHALLIDAKNVEQLASAIEKMISNSDYRQYLIKEAAELVKENTLEFQSHHLVKILKELSCK